ncbi:MAG: aminotransferase class I/II-fold pyridoxal phosphate-dependent enzyme [Clostridiales bacterium]|nr:aminotransferase class I/II-fold pyridoxal phosphate-dependent enzyme [Clostridiales bacterium]
MLHFECDYTSGALDVVLKALIDTNSEQTSGYGEDPHCEKARAMIREKCGAADADVHFVVGGTQANTTVIAAALRPFEGVLCADTGHINVHETGAIEATGHKVLGLPNVDGKITAAQVEQAVTAQRSDASHEHIVRPAMVYISHPTELGTLYTKEELVSLSNTCKELGLTLFLDGARLGYGLAAERDIDFALLAKTCDAFTIGGTKVGLLFGEAIVLTNHSLKDCFRYHIKQRGGMLAKGRLLGVQFEALMQDDLYIDESARANGFAQQLKDAFIQSGCKLYVDTVTNQIFPILSAAQLDHLSKDYQFSFMEKIDEKHSAVRFCTSVLTKKEEVEKLLMDIHNSAGN